MISVRGGTPLISEAERLVMFDSLDEQMKHDEREQSSTKERVLRYIAIGAVSVLVFGGLIVAVGKFQ
jgi:hypothetical protein